MATIPTEDYGYQTPTVPLGASSSTLFTSVEGSSITTISAGTINADQFRYKIPQAALGNQFSTFILTSNEPIDQQGSGSGGSGGQTGQSWYFS